MLIVPTTDGEAIEQFSIRVAEAWKIGRKKIDDGALLVVAKNDRSLRIEVGYGLEGALTDATAKRIIDEDITPKFKSGDFAGGISAGVNRMIRVIDGEKLPEPEPEHWNSPGSRELSSTRSIPLSSSASFVIGGILRAMLGRLLGSVSDRRRCRIRGLAFRRLAGGSRSSPRIIAFLFTLLQRCDRQPGGGRWQAARWSGGGGSGSSGSSSGSSSSGGFSGGGGSFGGGGASGSW